MTTLNGPAAPTRPRLGHLRPPYITPASGACQAPCWPSCSAARAASCRCRMS